MGIFCWSPSGGRCNPWNLNAALLWLALVSFVCMLRAGIVFLWDLMKLAIVSVRLYCQMALIQHVGLSIKPTVKYCKHMSWNVLKETQCNKIEVCFFFMSAEDDLTVCLQYFSDRWTCWDIVIVIWSLTSFFMANNLVTSRDPARTNSICTGFDVKCVTIILFSYLLIRNWRFLQNLEYPDRMTGKT